MMSWLLLLVPLSFVLSYFHAPSLCVFAASGVDIISLADQVRRATEALSKRVGATVGGLLNITFGNMTELLLSFFVLWSGQIEVVKASIIGSIIGNSLLFANPLERIAVAAAAFAVRSIAQDGETNWFEGALLLCVYVLLALAFFFATPDQPKFSRRSGAARYQGAGYPSQMSNAGNNAFALTSFYYVAMRYNFRFFGN